MLLLINELEKHFFLTHIATGEEQLEITPKAA